MAEEAKIASMIVWLRFPILPVEYSTEKWLRKAGDEIGKTIKVDSTTLATTRGKFARVCIEIDLGKPLRSRYRMRGREWRLQYEGLYDMCYLCGKYGHQETACPGIKNPNTEKKGSDRTEESNLAIQKNMQPQMPKGAQRIQEQKGKGRNKTRPSSILGWWLNEAVGGR